MRLADIEDSALRFALLFIPLVNSKDMQILRADRKQR
jgi:hypothetical protein